MSPLIGFIKHNTSFLAEYQEERTLRFQAGRQLAKKMISEEKGLEIQNIQFSIGKNGKPSLLSAPSVFFNISHTKGLTVCAIGNSPVGIDVEKHVATRNIDAIVQSYFHTGEINTLYSMQNEKERMLLFYRYWTAKEAFIKAHGRTVLEIGNIPEIREETSMASVCSQVFEIDMGYTIAICILGASRGGEIRFLEYFAHENIRSTVEKNTFFYGFDEQKNTGGRT